MNIQGQVALVAAGGAHLNGEVTRLDGDPRMAPR